MKRSSKSSGLLALGLMLFAVLACSTGDSEKKESSDGPIPADKKDYIGDWNGQFQGGTLRLSITPDGTVNYERKEGSTSKSISNGTIKKFDGNDFEVEAFIVSTTFKVEKPPYRDGAVWKMIVDGVEVSRKDSGETASSAGKGSGEFKLLKAEMRKADSGGEMTKEVVNSFSQSEQKIFCYINWGNPKVGTKIKFAFVAVDAGGASNETFKEFNLTTENELQNEAFGSLTLTKPLPKGSYKVDIYVNDKLERSVPFTIE
jgi:hypothetical protein